jgi:predicted dehydrogenase
VTFWRPAYMVLIEKPITVTIEEADELIALVEKNGVVFQVGHLERFNPVLQALDGVLREPLFIESVRIAPFKPRGTDVNVVLDLMIHDIEIIQNIVKSPVERVDAVGAPVFTGEEDIANARILIENGCVANVTASRISLKSERKMRIFQRDAIMAKLSDEQISSAIFYPIPLHKQDVFAAEYAGLTLQVAEDMASRCMSKPVYPEMPEESVRLVAQTIQEALVG